jgi:asparagine synthase (glutamine-hydrolysing)
VQKRLRSDVAIGTSLSGGLDSSAIVAFCSQQVSEQYTHKCFTAVFPNFEKDEAAYAAQVAEAFHLQHYKVEIESREVVNEMERVMSHQESPFTSASALAQFKVYEAAKQNGVTVLLDGQGADEILGGYSKYYKWQWQDLYRKKSLAKSNELAAARALGINEPFGIKNKAAALFPQFAAAMLQTKKRAEAAKNSGLNKDFLFSNKQNSYYITPAHFDLNSVLYFNTVVYGLEELLHLADRNSAAHAVEIRLPFLAHKLVEFLFSLPPHFKINGGWTKWLLRKSAEPLLPQNIVWRKDKVGFEPPQKAWMQNPSVIEAIQDSKIALVKKGILDERVLSKKVQPHSAYAADNLDWRYWSASFLFRD